MADKKTAGKKKKADAKPKKARGSQSDPAHRDQKVPREHKPPAHKKPPEKARKEASGKKAKVLSTKGTHKGDVALPEAFDVEYRPDLIQRAFVFEQSLERQPYGTDPRAGFRTTADYYSRRRGYYRMTVNRGMSRLPRQKIPGGGLGEVRRVPQSKGGHRAHPPKAGKKWAKKMNEKEWILALKSAIGATGDLELVTGNGRNHAIKDLTLPLIVDDSFESLNKAKEVSDAFEKLGLAADIERAGARKTKAGKARTGKTKLRKSVLVIVSGDCPVAKAAKNLAGVDITDADSLNVTMLAPGGFPGRLTLWTEAAIEKISS